MPEPDENRLDTPENSTNVSSKNRRKTTFSTKTFLVKIYDFHWCFDENNFKENKTDQKSHNGKKEEKSKTKKRGKKDIHKDLWVFFLNVAKQKSERFALGENESVRVKLILCVKC